MNELNLCDGKTTFIFVRHAESAKNLQHITGGVGDILTDQGIKQSEGLAKHILTHHILTDETHLISSDVVQAIQTANVLSDYFNLPVTITKDLKPAGMGIIAGMSSDSIRKLYPDIAQQLIAWRNREIEAVDLSIAGMEPPDSFWSRIMDYLKSLCNRRINLIICTRSIMVLVANLVMGNTPERGGGYKHIPVKHCEMISFRCSDSILDVVECPSITTLSARL